MAGRNDMAYNGTGVDNARIGSFDTYYDVKSGGKDYLLDIGSGDYVLLPNSTQNKVIYFNYNGYACGLVAGLGLSYYLFAAPNTTAAQLQSATLFI
jgi:hypothetical protein